MDAHQLVTLSAETGRTLEVDHTDDIERDLECDYNARGWACEGGTSYSGWLDGADWCVRLISERCDR